MARNHVSPKQIAFALGVKYGAANQRLNGSVDFKVSELIAVRDKLFPTCTLDYLAGVTDDR